MAMSVRERVREVGVLKTLGFTRRQYPVTHSGRSGAPSATLRRRDGFGLAFDVLTGGCSRAPHFGMFCSALDDSSRRWRSACILAVAAVIGLVSSFVPAWNASRTTIVEALRSTE